MYAVSVVILTLTVAVLQLTTVTLTASCTDNGWFGTNCKYQCHCANDDPCEKVDGSCRSGCHASWFGPACQYQRIGFKSTGLQWLSDDDGSTCNQMPTDSVNVELETAIPLTWVRIAVSKSGSLKHIDISYELTGFSSAQFCSPTHLRAAQVDPLTLDIYCPTDLKVERVVLTGSGVAELCSLYISGGRNVALKQLAQQSQLYYFPGINTAHWQAEFAVDGNPGNNSEYSAERTCSHTNFIGNPDWWSVTFSTAVNINRILIKNREDCCEDRLIGFSLEAEPEPGNPVIAPFSYTDNETTAKDIYTVIPSPRIMYPVKKILISQVFSRPVLTLCEVYVFGEVRCADGKFGLACERQCDCDYQAGCFVHSGGCSECAPAPFGLSCVNCSAFCGGDNSCNRITGECCHGCDAGHIGLTCETQCSAGTYGAGCSSNCSSNCAGPVNACSHESGACTECEPGLYGDNCTQPCSDGCAGSGNPCRSTDGSCDEGCLAGYTGDKCDGTQHKDSKAAASMTWALVLSVLLVAILATAFLVWSHKNRRENEVNAESINTSANGKKEGGLPEEDDHYSGPMENIKEEPSVLPETDGNGYPESLMDMTDV